MSSLENVVHEPIDLIHDANDSWKEPFFARQKYLTPLFQTGPFRSRHILVCREGAIQRA
jgi:hypothetical protein